ncbi:unnamed protein product (macronuclear) [Paramecium tetraurelia]|uniref:Polymerase nucleotidyl transferase domain-containing protein n=1 Tax=Paramecium tetraurelia TaxID=5888 RepID=A0CYW1_PARTE|nr:uncharacterized protein GSPATT00011579001 [Paramecium tetraurelia]CAK75978.1 unnamed protein product [Paramecium tetraurelia]|eukprot:XP_001443375.1 hypothetical protein (macronuclear) [Paramecium tetraurelia strain d4-2]
MSMKLQLFPKKLPLLLSEFERCNYALDEQNPRFPSITEDIKKVCLLRKRRSHEEEKLHLEQKLLSKIYIVDQDEMFEKFCLQGSLEDNINLLIECSNGLAFSSQPKVSYNCITKQYIVNDAIWFNPKTYQSCTGWITNEFEKAIALLYYQHQQDCIEENNLNKDEDLKRFWIQDLDLRTKILNQIPQICKEFKNAPKKKNTKQEDILWTQLILKQSSPQNDKQVNQDQNLQMMLQSINESDVSTIIMNNELESINYMPLEKILTIQILCQRRILRLIRDHYKEKLMKDIQNIEGKEKKKNVEQKKKSKKHKKQKNKNEQKKINMNQDKSNSFELADKQDTTQDDVHCNEYEIDKPADSSYDITTNAHVSAKSQLNKNAILEMNLVEETNQILDAQTIIELNNNNQNDDDDNWVVITAPKKQKNKSKQKLATSQEDQFKKQKSQQKSIPSKIKEQSVKSNAHDQDLFSSQKSQKRNAQAIETIKQDILMVNREKPVKQQSQEIANPSSQDFAKDNQISISKQEETKNISLSPKMIEIVDLSLKIPQEVEKLVQTNPNINTQMDIQNTPQKQPIKEDQIDYAILNQARALMIKKLDMDMREFSDVILGQNQQILKFRRIIYDRLQFVINYLYRGFIHHIYQLDFNSQVCLFGSCATGLALPESDIDIGITGFEMCSPSQLNLPIQKLTEFLQKMRWVNNIVYFKSIYFFRAITSSAMPLIKLQVDPTISFVQSSLPIGLPYIDLVLNPDEDIPKQIFSVDVSFFQYSGPKQNQHLGLISTDLTLQWLSFYSELRPIVLLFKSLLKKRGLNDQYKGGISSFCIIQMVLAFLECFYHQNQVSSIGYTTYNFLKFYGTEFDPKTTGISYKGFNENPFYELNEYDDQSEITIVSPITNEIISSATSFVLTILQDLKALYQATENEVTFFYEKLKFNKKKKGKKEERNLFQKELNRLRPLFSTTVYNKT